MEDKKSYHFKARIGQPEVEKGSGKWMRMHNQCGESGKRPSAIANYEQLPLHIVMPIEILEAI